MASLYQRILILTFLIIAFAGRVAVYAINTTKSPQEIVKENNSKSDQSDSNEKDGQVEEKIKIEDLAISGLTHIDFLSMEKSKTVLFSGHYNLLKSYLQTLEYPPK